MAATYKPKQLDTWAIESLLASGYEVTIVHRVYIPKDEGEGDCEVLYLDCQREPRTAYLMPDGTVLASRPGW